MRGGGCTPRLHPRLAPCDAGVRVVTDRAWLTFRKPDVLRCADLVARRYRKTDGPTAQYLRQLAQRYAADTARLRMVPPLDQLETILQDTATLRTAELFYMVDACLLKHSRFCAVARDTQRPLPRLKFTRIKGNEDSYSRLCTPEGTVLYHTRHWE